MMIAITFKQHKNPKRFFYLTEAPSTGFIFKLLADKSSSKSRVFMVM
jgi:hypothetical protein